MRLKKQINWDNYFSKRMYPTNNGWHKNYLSLHKRWYYPWIKYIDRFIDISSSSLTAFEVGTGLGAAASLLYDRGVSVTASDISPKAVKVAASLSKKIRFIVCDVEKEIPGPTKYDRILAFEVLEHLSKPDVALYNIAKHLKKGGYFIGTTPYPYPKNLLDPTHVNVQKPKYWKELFSAYGFSPITLMPLSCMPLLWRIAPVLHLIIPFYIPFPYFVSTTLIIARKS